MTPIRVLHLIGSSRRGGAEGVVAALATGCRQDKVQSEVGLLEPGWLAEQLAAAGVRIHWLAKRRALDWPLLRDLTRVIRRERPDVIHCHLGTMNLYGCPAARADACVALARPRAYHCPRPGTSKNRSNISAKRGSSGFPVGTYNRLSSEDPFYLP